MITRFTFLLAVFGLAILGLNGQTFVNSSAGGANDGSSWENAYTSLDSALLNSDSGEIWVASGTYAHDGAAPDTFRTFFIKSAVGLYGGFAGTEASKEERDPTANVTLLTADFNGDDIMGNFDTLRSDNSYHVITIDSFITEPVVIDGFTISGGNTNTNADLSQYNRRGAGIYAWSTVDVRNCRFEDNFARGATGIFLDPAKSGGSGSNISDNVFTGNVAVNRGAGIYFFNQSNITIENNLFTENFTSRGCVYPFRSDNILIKNNKFTNNNQVADGSFTAGVFIFESTNVLIDSCEFTGNVASSATGIYYEAPDSTVAVDNLVITNTLFDNNQATTGFGGGALYFWQAVGVRIEDCTFSNTSGGNGGIFYHDGRAQFPDANNLVFRNCEFLNNTSTDFGGGVGYAYQSSMTFEDCTFDGNTAGNGGSLYTSTSGAKEVILRNCDFSNGEANFGGCVNLYGVQSEFLVEGCTFTDNKSGTSGGAIITGFTANTTINNCQFTGNTSDASAAAIRIQNDLTDVSITNSTFTENVATTSGGAILASQGFLMAIDTCEFTLNAAESGGAITTFEDTVATFYTIDNSILQFNSATTQGGALNVVGNDLVVTNSVLNNNFNLDGISGGAISGNSSGVDDSITITLINCTVALNEGPVGAGVGLWTDGAAGSSTLVLQNTIMANEGANYQIEEGTPTVVSLGGNLSTDASLAGAFNAELNDIEEVEAPIFIDPDNGDFHLIAGSPAINIGVEPAPTTDIEGSLRVGAPDAGAYESQFDVSVKDILVPNNNQLKVAPNPVAADLNLIMDNAWEGEMTAKLFNVSGQLVETYRFVKAKGNDQHSFSVSNLPTGLYDLVVGDEKKVIAAKVIKQ